MRKTQFLLLTLVTIVLFSCGRSGEPEKVLFDQVWKFHPGDDLAWASPEAIDSTWDSIDPSRIWEEQGYSKYDGFAWYRTTIHIPATLKRDLHPSDSILFLLGRVDDCDQVFLNGKIIGENGRTLSPADSGSNHFSRIQGFWDKERKYKLAPDDPRILWDQENVIAIRAYDQGGAGGVFRGPFFVARTALSDYLELKTGEEPFSFLGDSVIEQKIVIGNRSGKEQFTGLLRMKVVRNDLGILIVDAEWPVTLPPGTSQTFPVYIKGDFRKASTIRLSFHESIRNETLNRCIGVPYLLTPPDPATPRINGAKIFGATPKAPFLFQVAATGEQPLTYLASGLPDGLKIDTITGQITGSVAKSGEYLVLLQVKNALGYDEREFRIVIGEMISLTPPLGWNSWNCWGLSVSDRKIRESALAMKQSGLIGHGWSYINIDDGWENTHNKDGWIVPNAKFPNMRGLCDYIHSLGLKAGIYSSPGPRTCGGYEGSYGFVEKDAIAYASWGFDYLKYDWCSYWEIAPKPDAEDLKRPYHEMRRALRNSGRDIHYSLCQYGMGEVWKWGQEVDGNSWRTTGDIVDTWESMSTIGFGQDKCSPYAAPGRWNDPDMLVVGWVGWGPALHYTHLTPDEQYTHITLWSLLASPLLIGCDLSQLDPFTLNLLSNDEVLAINQDPLGKQATLLQRTDSYEIWSKDLEDGTKAIGLFNKSEKAIYIPVEMSMIPAQGKQLMRDCWRQTDLGWVKNRFEMRTEPHGARMISLAPVR